MPLGAAGLAAAPRRRVRPAVADRRAGPSAPRGRPPAQRTRRRPSLRRAPSAWTSALAPGLADVGASHRTTVASANGSPRRWSSAATVDQRLSHVLRHSVTPWARSSFHTLAGVIGMSMWRTPRCQSASTTALAMAGGRAHRGRLADALGAEGMVRRRSHRVAGLPLRGLDRGGHQVVDEAAALDVADLVVGDLLEQRGRQAHA